MKKCNADKSPVPARGCGVHSDIHNSLEVIYVNLFLRMNIQNKFVE